MTDDYIVMDMVRETKRARARELEQYERLQALYPAVVRSFEGSCRPRWDENLLWVKLYGIDSDLTAVWNGGVISGEDAAIAGTPVLLKKAPRSPYQFRIIGINEAHISGGTVGGSSGTEVSNHQIGHHAENHQIPTEDNPGNDPLYVDPPMLRMLKTEGDSATLTVIVYPITYLYGGIVRTFPGQYVDLTSYVPGAGLMRNILIYLDESTGVLNVSSGSTVSSSSPTPPPTPTVPTSGMPSAVVELTNGQTVISTASHITDARPFITTSWSGVNKTTIFEGDASVEVDGPTNTVTITVDGSTIAVFDTSGLTMSGDVAMIDNLITRPVLQDYGEAVNAIGDFGGGAQDINLELGNVVTATVSTSEVTFTFSNPPASGVAGSFTLILVDGGSQTVNWPVSVAWAGGSAPSLTASGVDILTFMTTDGGTTWFGFPAGLNMS